MKRTYLIPWYVGIGNIHEDNKINSEVYTHLHYYNRIVTLVSDDEKRLDAHNSYINSK